ncbi:hypothetical protein GCM10027321_15870 [Massilia terrae]|uniref:DUF4214 domain-containing protein n=1 Tax=Massilia terrae TaxID=1811224 RepID=A0ABT2D167_9BURK|nr:DUF4214 domain-containing protein [Massilia terrae]MCS0659968.1 DUF4214 domain-containing protein [Massilia terrae]
MWGLADPGTTVQLWSKGALLGSFTVRATDGLWNTPTGFALPDGSYYITAVSIDAAGNQSAAAALAFSVDNTAPAPPTIQLDDPGSTNGLAARFSGSAQPGSTLELTIGQANQITTTVDFNGHWSTNTIVPDGHYNITATARDEAGNVSTASTLVFDRTPDDFGNDASHAAPFAVDSTISGAINFLRDVDWFKLNLEELTTYTLSLKAAKSGGGTLPWVNGNSSAVFQLWDPQANDGAGQFVFIYGFASNDADEVISLSPSHSGTYYVLIGAPDQVGSYSLQLATFSHDDFYSDRARAATIGAGVTSSGRFDFSGDLDMFKVKLNAGVTYQVDLAGGPTLDSMSSVGLELTDAANSMRVWSTISGQHALATIAPAATGDFYIAVSYSGFKLGSYQLNIAPVADDFGASPGNSGTLAIGSAVQGKIDVAGDLDWFAVNLQAGTSYTFQLDQGSAGAYATLYVHDASGARLNPWAAQYDHGRLLTWTPDQSGTYYLDVGNYDRATPYVLQARAADIDDHGATAATAGLIAPAQTISGRLETPYDVDWYKITAKANAAYSFVFQPQAEGLSSYVASGTLNIVDSSGRVISSGLYFDGARTLTWQAAAAGDYYVAVSAYDAVFSYTIAASMNDQDIYSGDTNTSGTLSPGGVVRSAIDFAGDTDWFKVDLEAGQRYSFQLTGAVEGGGTLAAPELRLYNASKSVLWTIGGSSYNDPYTSYTPTVSGTYYLQVRPDYTGAASTGSYTLKEASATVPIADTTPPVALALSAPESAGSNPQADHLYIHFSEAIQLGTGAITLRLASGQLVETFDAATSSRLSVPGDFAIAIDPSAPLAYGTSYRIELDATAVKDKAGLALAAPFSTGFVTVDQPLNQTGGVGNDIFHSSNNSDTFDGGPGLDTVVYHTSSSGYTMYFDGHDINVAKGELDTLHNIERVLFNDRAIAFDLDGAAGQAYRLYRASFDRVPDTAGLGYWIAQMDKGMSLHDVAQQFIASAEFKTLFGAAPSDAAFVTALYGNVLHRQPDQAGADYWTAVLAKGADRTDVLVEFSTSAENQAAVVGQISQGISYLPFH